MSEPCTIYSTRREPFSIAEIQNWAGDGKIEPEGVANNWEKVTIQWSDCTMVIHGRQRDDLNDHLDGFRGYIWNCAGEMTQAVYAAIQRIYSVRNVYGTTSEPSISGSAIHFLKRFAAAGAGVVFRGDTVFNPDFDLLVGPGAVAEQNRPAYWPDALERSKSNAALLRSRGFSVPESLPPVVGEPEVILRSPPEVRRRAFALYAVAYRAVPNGIGRGKAWSWLKGEENSLSPAEQKFLKSFFPGKRERVQFAWRFESLATLLWTLGFIDHLGHPSRPIEGSAVDAVVGRVGKEGLLAAASLRSTAEILDQLDLIYRYHWLTTDARVKNSPMPQGVDPGVVFEQHYALNWITGHQGQDWDDVNTDT